MAQKKEYVAPEELDLEKMEVTPEIEETYKTRFVKKTPSELVEVSPEIGEAEPFHDVVANLINNVDGLNELKNELQAKIKEVRENELKPLQEQFKQLSKEEQAELRNVFLVAGEIQEGLKGINKTVFGDYANQLVALQNKLVETKKRPGVVEELSKIKEILVANHEDIADSVFEALEEYMESASTIERTMERTLSKFPYRKTPRKKSYQLEGQAFEKLKDLFKGIWGKIKDISKNLADKVFPKAEQSAELIEDTLTKLERKSYNQRLKVALGDLVDQDDPIFKDAQNSTFSDLAFDARVAVGSAVKKLEEALPTLQALRQDLTQQHEIFTEVDFNNAIKYAKSVISSLQELEAIK